MKINSYFIFFTEITTACTFHGSRHITWGMRRWRLEDVPGCAGLMAFWWWYDGDGLDTNDGHSMWCFFPLYAICDLRALMTGRRWQAAMWREELNFIFITFLSVPTSCVFHTCVSSHVSEDARTTILYNIGSCLLSSNIDGFVRSNYYLLSCIDM